MYSMHISHAVIIIMSSDVQNIPTSFADTFHSLSMDTHNTILQYLHTVWWTDHLDRLEFSLWASQPVVLQGV